MTGDCRRPLAGLAVEADSWRLKTVTTLISGDSAGQMERLADKEI
jgi:hypothetical protein